MIFVPSDTPRLFALPPGVDFATELVAGLMARAGHLPPEALARVEILVNTRRMQRRLREVFDSGPARLLPRVRLVTDLALDPGFADIPLPVPPLRRRLDLTQLVARLLEEEPDLAPRAALFDLSDSLAALMDEMQGEGVEPARLRDLDVADQSGHWQRSLRFLSLVQGYIDAADHAPDTEARQRMVIERLADRWRDTPPDHPVIVAGSTGSRGATALFMEAVSRLPQGAVVLPGFDTDLPESVWSGMSDARSAEDHPQYRFRRLMDRLDLAPGAIARWTDSAPASPARNALVSLALRPAPVTDQWQSEGPALAGLAEACAGLTLVEAASPRAEAEAIALRLRRAVEDGQTAALITPDRVLTRQVASALDRWRIEPDDSAGQPLPLSAPGRFLRHVAELIGTRLTAEALLVLLKHPLCNGAARGPHLLFTRELELHLRRNGPPFPTGTDLMAWAKDREDRQAWARWIGDLVDGLVLIGPRPLAEHVADHLRLAEAFAAGPDTPGSGPLWEEAAGRAAAEVCADLTRHAEAGGILSPRDYQSLFHAVLNRGGEVRDRDTGHPQVLIWGTLEARVRLPDVAILAGLNEGTWPEAPAPDPWLNRAMRHDAGLLLPDRRIGLAAHDFQQAVAGREVWLTRARRSDEAETVPSRWVNRLTNLLAGLEDGRGALQEMRDRGDRWLAQADALTPVTDTPVSAIRPSPRPPVEARPRQLSVTQVKTLIRDPYAIYASKVLRLSALDPLSAEADARLRGNIVHEVLERFVRDGPDPADPDARAALLAETDAVLARDCPWPTMQRLWKARMERIADWFLETEVARRHRANPVAFEARGEVALAGLEMTLVAKADRIDRAPDGQLWLYDYKTGQVPSKKMQKQFDKQLLLEAAMTERGAFPGLDPAVTAGAVFVGLGGTPKEEPAPLEEAPAGQVWDEFTALVRNWRQHHVGYSARPFPFKEDEPGDFDHLARRGEWDATTPFTPEEVE